jgi:glycerol kinase
MVIKSDSLGDARDHKSMLVDGHLTPTPRDGILLGSIDQGTTSSRFLIFDTKGDLIAGHQLDFESLYPHSGWHEQDPLLLVSSVEACIAEAVNKLSATTQYSASAIRTIGITNQRETTVVWDSNTGEPLYNAIVWPDTRTAGIVRELRARDPDAAESIREKCGLPLSTYPSSVKMTWLMRNSTRVQEAYEKGTLCFGTVDSWLVYRLNGGASREGGPIHVTDSTNASRTMFVDLRTLQYDDELFSFFGLDRKKIRLPEIVPSSSPTAFGEMNSGPLKGVRIAGCLGDQSAALVGQCGFSPGQAKNTYGTGCFLLYNVGTEPVISKTGLLSTVAYDLGKGQKPVYALEGSIAVAGSGINFLINNLGLIQKPVEVDDLAETVVDNGGVVFVTAFSGLFAPYWIDDAKGTLFGITHHTKPGHIARATLEATCFQTKAILDAMERDSGKRLESLAVDGGLSASDLCMQTQADVTDIPVDRPAMRETTALGAAIAAGLALDIWPNTDALKKMGREGRTVFEPRMNKAKTVTMIRRWERAVRMCKGWVAPDEDDDTYP